MSNIRLLRADEIECRIGTFKDGKGLSLLLYKDARVDMNILDETFGRDNWQRHHEVINGNLFCNVGVRVERENNLPDWVWKQDVGTESNTEKEKGQASDAFKRACFNWGIGRELYTAPFIWINETNKYTKFKVKEIGYNHNREINHLVIVDDKGKERYRLGKAESTNKKEDENKKVLDDNSIATEKQLNLIYKLAEQKKYTAESMATYIKNTYNKGTSKELNKKEASELIKMLQELSK